MHISNIPSDTTSSIRYNKCMWDPGDLGLADRGLAVTWAQRGPGPSREPGREVDPVPAGTRVQWGAGPSGGLRPGGGPGPGCGPGPSGDPGLAGTQAQL